jgi:hypothetical protein
MLSNAGLGYSGFQIGADDLRRRRHLRIVRRIELDFIGMAVAVDHLESWRDARRFAAGYLPTVDRDRVEPIGAAHDLVDRHVAPADPVDEPARIGDFVDAVHVLGSHRLAAGQPAERVDEEVVAVAVVDRYDVRRVARLVIVNP